MSGLLRRRATRLQRYQSGAPLRHLDVHLLPRNVHHRAARHAAQGARLAPRPFGDHDFGGYAREDAGTARGQRLYATRPPNASQQLCAAATASCPPRLPSWHRCLYHLPSPAATATATATPLARPPILSPPRRDLAVVRWAQTLACRASSCTSSRNPTSPRSTTTRAVSRLQRGTPSACRRSRTAMATCTRCCTPLACCPNSSRMGAGTSSSFRTPTW